MSSRRVPLRKWLSLAVLALITSSGVFVGGNVAAQAATPKALINAATVVGSPSQEEAIATAAGFAVTVIDDATWGTYTAADFGQYDLLIAGDPSCGDLPPGLIASASIFGPVVLGLAGGRTLAGNRIVVGTDPVFHDSGDYTSPDARGTVIREGIAYAGSQPGTTGMYFDSTCADGQSAEILAILTAMTAGTGAWTIDADPPCGGNVSLIASHPSFSDLTTASLQGWNCSVHDAFPTFPTDWSALAVATDTETTPTCGVDPDTGLNACGEAYILIAGSEIVVSSKVISVSPIDATNPAGTSHTVTANVHDASGAPPVAGQLVDFSVTGQNAGATGTCVPADCESDVNGNVSFTYSGGAGVGDDTIKASFTDVNGSLQSATAQKHWVTGELKSTSTTYSGAISVQYSDAASLSGQLLDTTVSPNVGVPGRTLGFTIGTQTTSAGPTDASGNASTSLTVTQQPGSVTKVDTSFGGDSTYLPSSDSDAFSILKEDCTLTYSGDILVPALSNTKLAADLGEPDASLGDRSGKLITFTVTDSAANVQTFTATTDANGHAETSQPLGADVYTVNASFAGDTFYNTCQTRGPDAIVTVASAAAKVTGGGWISAHSRTNFGFNLIPQAGGSFKSQFQLVARNSKSRFHARVVSAVSTPAANSVSWSGTGTWKDQTGCSYQITVVDKGSPGRKGDKIDIRITCGSTVVYSTGGAQTLKGGNITVH